MLIWCLLVAMTGLKPAAAVIVATVRALKLHGGLSENDTLKGVEDAEAVEKGMDIRTTLKLMNCWLL